VSLVAAVVGGLVVAIGASTLGLFGDANGGSSTVFVPTEASAPPTAAAVRSSAKPLAGNGFDPAAVYAHRSPGVVTIYSIFGGSPESASAQGSGFVVDGKGTILTNSHVITNAGQGNGAVDGADRLYVEFEDGDRVPATIVGWDVFDDVGVIRVDPQQHALAPVPLGDSSRVVVGAPVAAIGSPFGNTNSLSVGVVSAISRSIPSLTSRYDVADAIQVDAPINHGNSGGPLFDARGRVIGITAQIRSSSGNAEGVGFVIPINAARRSLAQLLANGRVAYAFIGITTQDVTPGLARHFGFGTQRGALVTTVQPDSPAERAGLRGGSRRESFNGLDVTLGGDLITSIAGRPVRNAEDVSRIAADRLVPGQVVRFGVLRGGTTREVVSVKLAQRSATP